MLNEKVALITGSTSGIGLATAHVLAAQGINLVLHGLISAIQGQELADSFKAQYGIGVLFDNADLSDVASIEHLIKRAIEQMGSIDILINNAGIQHTESAENFPLDKWNAIIAINLSAAFHAIQYALPNMKSNGWGRIINVASVHGLVGLTKVLALECAEQGITVNAICPGWVDTPLINDQISAIAKQQDIAFEQAKYQLVTAKQPLPEMMAPEQIGEFILFLCSESARSITGSALPMDGAWTAQ